VEIRDVEILTIIGGLYCGGFINVIGVVTGVWRQKAALSIGPI
jgi:hypothetical protein